MLKSLSASLIAVCIASSGAFADIGQPNRVTCSVTLTSGSNPETGEGGTDIENSMILQANGQGQYNLYYVLGGQEYTLAKHLNCAFKKNDTSLYSCSKASSGINDCVHFDSGRFSRKIIVNTRCMEPVGVRVRETTFIQTHQPERSGGCFAD